MYRIRKFIIVSIWLTSLFCHNTAGRNLCRHVHYMNKRGTYGNVPIGSKKIINNNISKRRITSDIKTASASGSILTIRGGGSDGGGSRDSNRRSHTLQLTNVNTNHSYTRESTTIGCYNQYRSCTWYIFCIKRYVS